MSSRIAAVFGTLCVLVWVVACELVPGEGTPGVTGSGEFFYRCVNAYDAACRRDEGSVRWGSAGALTGIVPEAIALGARFDVTYLDDGAQRNVRPASPVMLEEDASVLIARRTGQVALYTEAVGGRVDAWINVRIVQASGMAFHGVPESVLEPGMEWTMQAELTDDEGVPLAGGSAWSWSVEPVGVVELTGPLASGSATVVALAAGEATLTIDAGGVRHVERLQVVAAASVDSTVAP